MTHLHPHQPSTRTQTGVTHSTGPFRCLGTSCSWIWDIQFPGAITSPTGLACNWRGSLPPFPAPLGLEHLSDHPQHIGYHELDMAGKEGEEWHLAMSG